MHTILLPGEERHRLIGLCNRLLKSAGLQTVAIVVIPHVLACLMMFMVTEQYLSNVCVAALQYYTYSVLYLFNLWGLEGEPLTTTQNTTLGTEEPGLVLAQGPSSYLAVSSDAPQPANSTNITRPHPKTGLFGYLQKQWFL
ncbi:hypothetical protein B0I72DRAFT_131855 [Yarrowia lipolytica]|uniref:Uncharacterized protein n=1 Tax=Yarrowia lipolytica TaxID=4952 RepID=A0A371C877_YARLL|nr:hypothetical protein B0I71DRAFT_140307 [Yarrowia lipolytica]RDW29524.1 hypothetical protein B0I72DRAFT_131855 [Yarrowia lipolytica]RDW37353.1 hypothetical protein B0I73DRAFT_142924 [Yarrowia lipolytica]RDW43180.1 hypothetical protein B0I74DRAFT_131338 [Yarrowia lipolytica]RDW49953.1 hypothetical protein B0I75DRAFT_131170 [Yarrowia lipolytica]